MRSKSSCWGKLSKFVTNKLIRNEYRDMLLSIINRNRMTYH